MGRDRPAASTPLERRAAIGAAIALAVLGAAILAPRRGADPRPAAVSSPTSTAPTAAASPGGDGGAGGVDPEDPDGPGEEDRPEVPLRLVVRSREAVLTGGRVGPAAARRSVRRAAVGIRAAITRYHREAFVAEENWTRGRYGPAFEAFVGAARLAVRGDIEVLTLGREAGSVYLGVTPVGGWLRLRVLLNPRGRPVSAVALSVVRVRAGRAEGGDTLVVVRGRFFMQPGKGTWLVMGYDVERDDRPAEA
ncbi:MAG: hypothetical protein HY658_08890 [Actinobacteria bacterium]|nr:hypothetical protein [Actinomycetota bacterium]